MPGIERCDESPNRPALPGRIPALEDDADRRADALRPAQSAEAEPQLRKALADVSQIVLLLTAGEAQGEVDFVESSDRSILLRRDHGDGDLSTRGGVSVVTLRARGKRNAPRAIRITPAATSQRELLRCPRIPIAKPQSISAM
jgi:hypothetical protein